MKRMQLMKMHALLAAFILPITLMFAITGALYTWGEKGAYDKEMIKFQLETPLMADVTMLTDLAVIQLDDLGISSPEGTPKLKSYGPHFLLEWTGSSKDVILEPGEANLEAVLTIKHTTWYRNLVQLHKAKGGSAFKIYAALFAISLVLLLFSGFIMAMQVPQLKKTTLACALFGFLSFFVFVMIS